MSLTKSESPACRCFPFLAIDWRSIMLTQEKLRSLLFYDAATGEFTWISSGQKAGCLAKDGYAVIQIERKQYRAHQLAWLYVHGEFLVRQLDHINHIRNDNRIVNLRKVTLSQNSQNQMLTRKNTSGYRGVCWDKDRNKWRADIGVNRKRKYLGHYETKEAAAKVYAKAAAALHTHNPFAEGTA
jgi:hypothetical protein